MMQSNMPDVAASLNGLADVYGKPHLTNSALVHWWETIKEFDYNDIMGQLSYWAKESGKMPSPKDLWDKLNTQRTGRIEEKASYERAMNRGDRLPDDWAPTEYGRRMLSEIKEILSKPSTVRREPKWPISMRRG